MTELSTSMLVSNVYQCFQSKSQTFMNFKSSINIVFSTTFPLKSDVYRRCVKKDFSMYLVFCIFGWSCTGTTPLNNEQTKQNLKPLSKILNQLNVWSGGYKVEIYWCSVNWLIVFLSDMYLQHIRRLMGSTNQAGPSCIYFRIS